MKKILCSLLTFCIFISAFSFAAASNASDFKDVFNYYNVLRGLEVIPEDFEYSNLDGYITKAEAVNAIVRLCSSGKSDLSQVGTYTFFKDVTESVKYADSINFAALQGIVNGDGTVFCPDNNITFREAITYFLRALGYAPYAQSNGGYPNGYARALRYAGLNKYVGLYTDDKIKKSEFIALMYDIAETYVIETEGFGVETAKYNKNQTVLEYFHDIYKISDRVNATFISSLSGYSPVSDANKMRVGNDIYRIKKREFSNYLGYYADVYCKKENGAVDEIVYIEKNDDTDELCIEADDIVSFDNLCYTYGEKKRSAKIADKHTLIINGKRQSVYSSEDFIPDNGNVILLGNGSKYDTVIINTYKNYFLQRMIVGGDDKLTLTVKESLRRFEIDLFSDTLLQVYKDGQKVDMAPFSYNIHGTEYETTGFTDIPEGSVASVFADEYEDLNGITVPSKDAKSVVIYVNTPKIYGVCTALSDDYIEVDGVEYEKEKNGEIEKVKLGDKGYFVKNYDDKVYAYYDNNYMDEIAYAYLIEDIVGEGLKPEMKVKLLKEDGYIETLKLAQRVKLNNKVEDESKKIHNFLSNAARNLDPAFTISQPVKFKLNDKNEVCSIWTYSTGNEDNTLSRDCDRQVWNKAGSGGMIHQDGTAKYLKPNRIFAVPETETFEEDDYRIMWGNEPKKTLDIFDVNSHRIPELVVSYEKRAESSLYREIIMVGDVRMALDDDGGTAALIRGYDGYGEVYYYSENLSLFSPLKEGDVISMKGHGEEIDSWEYVIKIDQVKNHDYSSEQGCTTSGLYEIYSVNENDIVFQHDSFSNDGEIGQRISRMCARWTNDPGSFSYGAVYYDGTKRKDKVSSIGITGGIPDTVKTVRNAGNDDSTKAYVIVYGGMLNYIALYDGIK